MLKGNWYLVWEEKTLHLLLPVYSSNDTTVGRDLFILGRWLDSSSSQTLAKLMLGDGYVLHFSFLPTKHPTSDPKSFFSCWWPGCKCELSHREHFPSLHAMPRDLTHGWAAAQCNPSSPLLICQITEGTERLNYFKIWTSSHISSWWQTCARRYSAC